MGRFSSKAWPMTGLVMATVALLQVPTLFADETSRPAKGVGRMNCGAQIECVTPDGRIGHISRLSAPDPNATALIMEDDTVTCLLQEGETNFVIELPGSAKMDRLTFLNENARARGELKIAVSDRRLAPSSSGWTEVEGVIPFAHKRLFGVSLLGIEAKYVRLSFRVEKQGVAAGTSSDNKLPDLSDDLNSEKSVAAFNVSALEEALNSKFAESHVRQGLVLVDCISESVAPLRLTSND
jgi:hypothetical protein